jgi:hypothetical protein
VDIDKAIRKGKKAKGFLYRTVGEYFLFGKKPNAVKAIGYIKAAIDDYGLKLLNPALTWGRLFIKK